MKRRSYDVTCRSTESTTPRLWRHPYKRNGKTARNSFAYCLVGDVKHNENDVECHEVSYVFWRRVSIKRYRGQLDAPLLSASGTSASSCPRHLGVAVLTIPQTGMKQLYTI